MEKELNILPKLKFLFSIKNQLLILLIIILITYSRTIFYDFNIDDYIITNSLDGKGDKLSDLSAISQMAYNKTDYRPVVLLSFGIQKLVFGDISAGVSHGINILFFYLVCVIALLLLRNLFEYKNHLLAFFAVLLFSVHPITTEVVCNIKSRDNLLSMLFGMCGTLFFIKGIRIKKKKYLFLFLSVLFSISGLLSKYDAIGFLLLNFCILLFTENRVKIKSILLLFATILFILLFVNELTKYFLFEAEDKLYAGTTTFTENPLSANTTLVNSLISFLNTIYFYFLKMAGLFRAKYYYGYNYLDLLSTHSVSFVSGLIILLLLLILFIYSIYKKASSITIIIIAIFCLSLYALNLIIPVAGIIADRYIFISNLFFCAGIIFLIFRLPIKNITYIISFIVFAACFIFFFLQSNFRIPAWKNQKSLIDRDAPELSNSYEAMRIAASTYFDEYTKTSDTQIGKYYLEKAIYYADKGIKVYPKNDLLYVLLGQYYYKIGNPEAAKSSLKISIKNNPTQANGYEYLGDIYYEEAKEDSALFYYSKAFSINPTSNLLINNISTIYYQKDKTECLNFNLNLLKKDSTLFAPYENLGYFYLAEEDTFKSRQYFDKAIIYGLPPNSMPIK